ncbi:MAG: AAA family ATPase [Proteobacteria bacterium]|nr:AAA family ATPase [Pseudomonadota bacterium]
MAHLRHRFTEETLKQRSTLWPVMGLLGPRQVGKSTLLKALCGEEHYVNLDLKQMRDEALKAPDFFIGKYRRDTGMVAIDEVQKVPDLFDAVKASVDGKRRPGTFLLAGSTQFSSKVGIRESLTGRIGLLRLWPLSLAELSQRPAPSQAFPKRTLSLLSNPKHVAQRLDCGGMPGICFVRSMTERQQLIEGWLETTCFRDVDQILGLRVRGEKIREALNIAAKSPEISMTELAQHLSISTPSARKVLDALETLMVLTRIPSHPQSSGKDLWLLCDAALAGYLGSSRRVVEQIVLHQELMCQFAFAGLPTPKVYFYRSTRGSFVDLVVEDKRGLLALLIVDSATPKPYTLRALTGFQKKVGAVELWAVGPFSKSSKSETGIIYAPWTHVM